MKEKALIIMLILYVLFIIDTTCILLDKNKKVEEIALEKVEEITLEKEYYIQEIK